MRSKYASSSCRLAAVTNATRVMAAEKLRQRRPTRRPERATRVQEDAHGRIRQPSSRLSWAIERTTWCATPSGPPWGAKRTAVMPTRRAPRTSESMLSPTIAASFSAQPHAPERELEERGLGLADDERPDARRRGHRLDDGAAAGQEVAVLERQARIDVGREEVGARGRGAGGGGEALVAEGEVVADHDHLRLLPLLDGHERVAALDHRLLELGPADGKDARRPPACRR